MIGTAPLLALALALVAEPTVVAAIGPTTFAALAWGSVALVVGVLGYEVYAVFRETQRN